MANKATSKNSVAPPLDSPQREDGSYVVEVDGLGPIDEVVQFVFKPGHLTLITGSNGIGKSKAIECVKTLGGGETAGIKPNDKRESGRVSGFGASIKFTAHRCTRTGQIKIKIVEEGYSIKDFVRPRFKTAEANDKQRLQDLANILQVVIQHEAIFALVGGKQAYAEIVSEKTMGSADPAEFVGLLKRDLDAAALGLEKSADNNEAVADGMEANLPRDSANIETDSEVLTNRLTDASNRKRDLLKKIEDAPALQDLIKTAQDLVDKGQGQTEEQAKTLFDAKDQERKDCLQLIADFEAEIARERVRLEGLDRELTAAQTAVTDAKSRAASIAEAKAKIGETVVIPTDAELSEAERLVTEAEAALVAGNAQVAAVEMRADIAAKRKWVEETRARSVVLRNAAQSCLSLLVDPINKLDIGIEVEDRDGNLRLVYTRHPLRKDGRCDVEELSPGEGYSLVIDLLVAVYGDEEALVWLPQEAYEGLDGHNRKVFRDKVRTTKLMFAIAECSKDDENRVVPVASHVLD